MPTASEITALTAACEATLRTNWREGVRADGVRFAYTCPSPSHYPWQWYWDSCFSAIAWRHFDRERSRRELESLLAAQREDGFIGHTIFWNRPLEGVRRFTYNVTEGHPLMTASIQPPTLAWAWRAIGEDPTGQPALAHHYDWLAEHRDLEGDGLIWIVQPDESGLDASPQFDAIWGPHAHGLPRFVLLVRRNRHLRYDLRKINAAGGPVCCEVLTNVLYSLSLTALGRRSLTDRIIKRLYDEDLGLFLPAARPQPRRRPAITWAALSPLALPDLPEAIGRRLVEQHLLDRGRFWLPVPPASVSATDPGFQPGEVRYAGIRRYWRGATWINSAWLLWLGLMRLGYREAADELVERVTSTLCSQGLREYYNPYTGAGLGAREFGWSSLVMELVQPDPAASGSYL